MRTCASDTISNNKVFGVTAQFSFSKNKVITFIYKGFHTMKEPWGWHLILDCSQGAMDKITDKSNILGFVKQLVKDIDMVAYGDPWIERFATHDINKSGISFCQMIETSNITGHFVELNGTKRSGDKD